MWTRRQELRKSPVQEHPIAGNEGVCVEKMMQVGRRAVVIGIGEVLWDLLPSGKQLGGAPANFAYHAGVLGAEAHLISAVGDDPLGRAILEQLDRLKVNRCCVHADNCHPTGTVSVAVDRQGKPSYIIHENVAWDNIPTTADTLFLAEKADALCFGSLAQRSEGSRLTISRCLAAAPEHCLRIFDINLRQRFYDAEVLEAGLRRASVLKLNDEELPVVAELLGMPGSDESVLVALQEKYRLKVIALTRGEGGAMLLAPDNRSLRPAVRASVVDTVGAGDAFTAALAVGLLRRLPLDAVNEHATRLAAFVCSQAGATPTVPKELAQYKP